MFLFFYDHKTLYGFKISGAEMRLEAIRTENGNTHLIREYYWPWDKSHTNGSRTFPATNRVLG